jgi:hypothetical protein
MRDRNNEVIMRGGSPVPLDAACGGNDDIVRALEAIVRDIDVYLSGWLRRLEEAVPVLSSAAKAATHLDSGNEAFQREKAAWETRRQEEVRRIEETAALLTDAWLRLEAEQREFLQCKDAQRGAARERVSSSPAIVEEPAPVIPASPGLEAIAEPPACSEGETARVSAAPPGVQRPGTIEQFRRLQQEIEQRRLASSSS